MPELSLSLFGPPRAALDGTAVPIGRRKALALLALLALEESPAGRDRLAAIFWPDEDPASSRASLRRMLSVLRAALGDAVDAGRHAVALRREHVRVDAVELRAAARSAAGHAHDGDALCDACAAWLASAVERCEGEFLDGL